MGKYALKILLNIGGLVEVGGGKVFFHYYDKFHNADDDVIWVYLWSLYWWRTTHIKHWARSPFRIFTLEAKQNNKVNGNMRNKIHKSGEYQGVCNQWFYCDVLW